MVWVHSRSEKLSLAIRCHFTAAAWLNMRVAAKNIGHINRAGEEGAENGARDLFIAPAWGIMGKSPVSDGSQANGVGRPALHQARHQG
jgi:hypothetical protein